MHVYSTMIQFRQPGLSYCFGFTDGLGLRVQEFGDPFKQNAYFSSWKQVVLCNNVFVFVPDGRIVFACINAPGKLCHVIDTIQNNMFIYKFFPDSIHVCMYSMNR